MPTGTFYIDQGTGARVDDISKLSSTGQYVQSGTGKTGTGASFINPNQTPISQTPASPAPQMATPSAPTPTTPAPTQPTATGATTATPQTTAQQPGMLTMPASGSIVDLLNMAGMDSSQAARKALAQQYGVQGYDFSATKNQELSKKFLDAYNALKSTKVPDTGAQATSALDSFFKENAPETQEDPERTFFDQYMSMNPVMKTMYDTITRELSRSNTQISFSEEYKNLLAQEGLPGLRTELMNVNRIMDGTEDDIREEITAVGGLATESQVQAMKGARNKTLLKQANVLEQQIAFKQDYVDQLMNFSKLDRDQVEKDLDRKLGLTEKLATIQDKMMTAASDNFNNIVKQIGYSGLANLLKDDPKGQKYAEQVLGLPSGAFKNAALLTQPAEWSEPYRLGGDIVQKNNKTGEIRTAVNVAKSDSAGGAAGIGGAMMGLDPSSPNYITQLMASTAGRKLPNQVETIKPIQKSISVINQLDSLQQSVAQSATGPIVGYFKKLNPYDFDARAVQAQLQSVVPNLARGVYGEVGVLTDQDIKNYIQTLPNITSTEEQNQFVMAMTLKTVQRNLESQLETLASAGYDVSGFQNQYLTISKKVSEIESRLGITSASAGTQSTKTGILPNGTRVFMQPDGSIIDAQGNKYDENGNKI